jgi:hypothetical protein
MPAKSRPQPIDGTTWNILVAACGSKCCVCGGLPVAVGPLKQGHIQRHADGGPVIFENLIPVCQKCNRKYNQGFTPDGRPDGWRDIFWPALMAENSTEIVKNTLGNLSGSEPTENKGLEKMESVHFGLVSRYRASEACPLILQHPGPLAHEGRAAMWKLVRKALDTPQPPNLPYRPRQDAMTQAAILHGLSVFHWAGEAFLWHKSWIMDEEKGMVFADSWQHFCDSFDFFVEDGRALAARAAKKKLEDEEARRQAEKEAKESELIRADKVKQRAAEQPAIDQLMQTVHKLYKESPLGRVEDEEQKEKVATELIESLKMCRFWRDRGDLARLKDEAEHMRKLHDSLLNLPEPSPEQDANPDELPDGW